MKYSLVHFASVCMMSVDHLSHSLLAATPPVPITATFINYIYSYFPPFLHLAVTLDVHQIH